MSVGKRFVEFLSRDITDLGDRKGKEERAEAARLQRLEEIRQKAERNYTADTDSHLRASTAGILVTEGFPCAIEDDPDLAALVEYAWGNKTTFVSFVNKLIMGDDQFGGQFTLTQAQITELQHLSDIVLDMLGLDANSSFHIMTPEQMRAWKILTNTQDPWDHIATNKFENQQL